MAEQTERDARGRWLPGQSANPTTQWGPDNPPAKSPGRPKRDAWLGELEERLKDSRVRQALADKLLRTALKGGEKASLQALSLIQDRVGGPVVRRFTTEVDVNAGVLVAPAGMTPEEWIESAMARAAEIEDPRAGAED